MVQRELPKWLKKVIAEFPDCERLLFEYDYKQKEANAEADWRNKIKV